VGGGRRLPDAWRARDIKKQKNITRQRMQSVSLWRGDVLDLSRPNNFGQFAGAL
jgi:hypothetical protein